MAGAAEEMEEYEDLNVIRGLIEQLRHDEASMRQSASKQICRIGRSLGPERCREELVPYLAEGVAELEDDEEVMLSVAETFGSEELWKLVGGTQHLHALLPAMETLASQDDSTVRDKAVESVRSIIEASPSESLQGDVLSIVRQLATSDFAAPKVSAPPLIAALYKRLPAGATGLKSELFKAYSALCSDDSPLVRKAACGALGEVTELLSQAEVMNEIMPLFSRLAQDAQDSVRIVAVQAVSAVAKALSEANVVELVVPVFRALSQDKAWRVRYMVADDFQKMVDVLPPQVVRSEMVPALVRLLKDAEAEVRASASFQISAACRAAAHDQVVAQLLPCVKDLVSDSNMHVRAALATVVLDIAPVIGKEQTISDLLPQFLVLLQDEFHEVRMNIIFNLDKINAVVGVESLSASLLPAIVDLAKDKSWRVRLSTLERMPLLAKQLGVEFFESQLVGLCTGWLSDAVFAVREAAVSNLVELTAQFGAQWATRKLLPPVLELASIQNYLHRNIALQAVGSLVPKLGEEAGRSSVPVLVRLTRDDVPNCRFNAIKAMEAITPSVSKGIVDDQVLPRLREMDRDDEDQDVRFFAGKALSRLG